MYDQAVKRITQQVDTLYNFHNSMTGPPTLTHAQVKEINRAIASLAVIVTEARIDK